MASGDTALWLHNKLGSTDDLWSGRTICSQLSKERLLSILECFHTLQPHVKVKLMLSFLHILRRNTEMWKPEMDEILSMAMMDTDPWVCMVAEILQTFPSTGSLNTTLEDSSQTFAEVLADLKKSVKKAADVRMLPIECQFLNKTALSHAAGQPPQPVKHFALKRKPKSAILRAELLQKSSEAATNKKNNVSNSVPIKSRSFAKKMDDTTPLKGLPGRSPSTPGARAAGAGFGRINNTPLITTPLSSRPASARKEGKIKFLELTEVPVGSKEAKRRKKVADMEAMELQKKEKEAAIAAGTAPAVTTATSITPDYAAGLVAPATPKITTSVVSVSSATLSAPTPAYVPASSSRLPAQPVSAAPATVSVTLSASTQAARQNLHQQLTQQLGQSQIRTQMIITQQGSQSQTVILQPQTTLQAVTSQQPATVQATVLQQQQPLQQQQQQTVQQLPQTAIAVTIGAAAATAAAVPAQATVGAPVKKGLSLTREQMHEAQEMFITSNKVTRPEKALILGFMAGSRDNPCPQQGPVLNIRLSEVEETVQQADGVVKRMAADTFFHMNYATGEWKRFKKFRELTS